MTACANTIATVRSATAVSTEAVIALCFLAHERPKACLPTEADPDPDEVYGEPEGC